MTADWAKLPPPIFLGRISTGIINEVRGVKTGAVYDGQFQASQHNRVEWGSLRVGPQASQNFFRPCSCSLRCREKTALRRLRTVFPAGRSGAPHKVPPEKFRIAARGPPADRGSS